MKKLWMVGVAGAGCLAGSLQAKDVEIRAITVFQNQPPAEVYVHQEGSTSPGTALSVKRYLNRESTTLDLKTGKLILTTEASAKSVNDEAKCLGKIEVPGKVSRGILVFVPAEGDQPATAHLVDDSAKAFPSGSFLVLNLTPMTVRVELEGKDFECSGNAQTPIKDPPVDERSASAMRAFYREQEGDEWIQVSSGRWPHPGKKRVLQVVMRDPQSKSVQLRGVTDVVEVD
ncbi:hypothetical protein [Haloferula sargassicola]